jgi:hypothetical protein
VAGKRGELVHRPPKKVEYEIRFATANARKGVAGSRRDDPEHPR